MAEHLGNCKVQLIFGKFEVKAVIWSFAAGEMDKLSVRAGLIKDAVFPLGCVLSLLQVEYGLRPVFIPMDIQPEIK
jgi:hypothetical protein